MMKMKLKDFLATKAKPRRWERIMGSEMKTKIGAGVERRNMLSKLRQEYAELVALSRDKAVHRRWLLQLMASRLLLLSSSEKERSLLAGCLNDLLRSIIA
jgi:hypothetical protein